MRNDRKLKTAAALLLIPVLLCSGCGRKQTLPGMELSRRLIVEAIGVDADAKGVTLTLLSISTQGNAAAEQNAAQTEPANCRSFFAENVGLAAALAEQRMGKVPFFAHARVFVMGRNAARLGAASVLDFFLRNRTVRNAIPVCVAGGTAAALLSAKTSPGQSAAQLLEDTLSAAHACGKCVEAPLFRFVSSMLSTDTEAYCPLVWLSEQDENEAAVYSTGETAVFRDERLWFSLDADDTTALLLMKGELKETLLTLPDEKGEVTCRLTNAGSRIRKTDDSGAVFLRLKIKAEITEAKNGRLPLDKKRKQACAALLKDEIKNRLLNCFDTLYSAHDADLLRLQRKGALQDSAETKNRRLRPEVTVTLD